MLLVLETHLKELKYRALFISVSFSINFIILYTYSVDLVSVLTKTLNKEIMFTDLSEAFICQLELSFIGSLYLSIPIVLYQFKSFFKPGLYAYEITYLNKFLALFYVLYVISLLFSLNYLLPIFYDFLKSYEALDNVSSVSIFYMPRLRELLAFIYKFVFVLTLVFEFPLIIVLLYIWNIVTVDNIVRLRKYNFIFSFIIGAIVSPPDIWSQICIAVPLVILYEFSIILTMRIKRNIPI